MKTGTILLLAGGGFALWYGTQIKNAADTINILIQSIQVNSLTNYVVILRVQNITNITVTVKSMTGSILLNGNSIASISDFAPVDVPANGQVDITTVINPDILGLPAAIQSVVNSDDKTLYFEVVGNANVSGAVLPFDLDKQISL